MGEGRTELGRPELVRGHGRPLRAPELPRDEEVRGRGGEMRPLWVPTSTPPSRNPPNRASGEDDRAKPVWPKASIILGERLRFGGLR